MKNKMKKAFTIVELVIVIAIIAILAAVLIPTFVNIIRMAQVSNDTQLVRNLNTALALDQKEHKTMQAALDAAEESGFDVAKISSKISENEILWDSKNDVFCYLNGDAIEYVPASVEDGKKLSAGNYQLWKISDTVDPDYSTYLYGYTGSATITTSKGLDVGETEGIPSIIYDRSTVTDPREAQNVVIRTNSYDTTVTINAPTDTVRHYDKANQIDITAVAPTSYHEYGDILGNINLSSGRVVAESGAKASAIVILATVAQMNAESNPVVIYADNTAAPNIPIIVPSDVKAEIDNKAETDSRYGITISDNNSVVSYDESAVAYVLGKGSYESISAAVTAAENNDTVILLKDCTLDSVLGIYKSIILDLGGNTITYSSSQYAIYTQGEVFIKNGGIVAQDSADGCLYIMLGSKICLSDLTLVGQSSYAVYSYNSDLAIDYCTLKSNGMVVSVSGGNLAVSNTTLMPYNLTKATLGIEYTGDGNVVIGENTVINGFATGIKITAGDFAPIYTIADSVQYVDCVDQLQLVGMPQNITEGGAGKVFNNAKINISGNPEFTGITSFGDSQFTISGGTFESLSVMGSSTGTISGGVFKTRLGVVGTSTLTITGGTFTFSSEYICTMSGGTISIKGGTFSFDPSSYLAEGYKVETNNGTYYVVTAD